MRRPEIPALVSHRRLVAMLEAQGATEPAEGCVDAEEFVPWALLQDSQYRARLPSLFLLRKPPQVGFCKGVRVRCAAEEFRRWRDAALAYAAAVDRVSAEVETVRERAARARWWIPGDRRRADEAWQEVQRRYAEVVQEASEAYAPVRDEIRHGIDAEKERLREYLRERGLTPEEWQRRLFSRRLSQGRDNPSGGTATGGTGGFGIGGF
ncbi:MULTISPECIES: hypothetical protein [unclassified Streptomyces]|uniref:hypothetical protein n=1 Tax=unclassified Streptomyces TaxID=2593676 RepID=UPI00336A66B0